MSARACTSTAAARTSSRAGRFTFQIFRIRESIGLAGLQEQDPPYTAPVTPAGDRFYADFTFDAKRNRLICVREDHDARPEPETTLVSIPLDGSESGGDVIASGYDFYSTPRLSRRWNAPRLAVVAASADAVGWHRAVGGGYDGDGHAGRSQTRRRRSVRVDLSARLVA